MIIAALLFVLLAPPAALLIVRGPVAAWRTAKLRPTIERQLNLLIWAANEWKGSYRDLVLSDYQMAGSGKKPSRSLLLVPSPEESWHVLMRPTKGIRLVMRLGQGEGPDVRPPTIYPYSGWSREPWLKAKVDHLLETIAKLPPPRTFEEETARHEAEMAEIDRSMAETDALLAELEAAHADPKPPEAE